MGSKKIIIILAVAVVILPGIWFATRRSSENHSQKITGEATIIMKSGTFEPADITIKKGTKVTFKNEDTIPRWPASNLHPTHTIYPEFDPKQPVAVGSDWSFVFDKVGSWKYHDHWSPALRGVINVEN